MWPGPPPQQRRAGPPPCFPGDRFITRFFPSVRSDVRRRLLPAVVTLAVLAAVSWATLTCWAQVPFFLPGVELVVYESNVEVGRVYRDAAGPQYTEHWVLFPNYNFDQGGSRSMQVVAVPGPGCSNARDFLARVPFPPGSRYVVAAWQEFDRLPASP